MAVNSPWSLDELINEVTKHVGKEWKSLAHVMGFSQTDVDSIEYDNSHNLKEQIHQLFHQWKQRESTNATPILLLEAINKANLQDVITKLHINDSGQYDRIPIDQAMHLMPKPGPKHLCNSLGSTKHYRTAKFAINIHYHFDHTNLLPVPRKRRPIYPLTKPSLNPQPELYNLVGKKPQSHSNAQQQQDSNHFITMQQNAKMCERDGIVYQTPTTENICPIDSKKPVIGRRRLFENAINGIKKESSTNSPVVRPDHSNTGKFRSGAQKITFSFPKVYTGIIIGTGGKNVRKIEKDTCTSIKLSSTGNRKAGCITGREENCSKALVQILTCVEHFRQHSAQSITLKLLGISRMTLRSIARLSGAKIIPISNTERGLCKVKGTTEQINDAKQLVKQLTITKYDIESETPVERLFARCKKIGFEF